MGDNVDNEALKVRWRVTASLASFSHFGQATQSEKWPGDEATASYSQLHS